jgi:hypothetical protein
VLYTEKIVNYFTPTTTTAAVTLPASSILVAATGALPLANGSITVTSARPPASIPSPARVKPRPR